MRVETDVRSIDLKLIRNTLLARERAHARVIYRVELAINTRFFTAL